MTNRQLHGIDCTHAIQLGTRLAHQLREQAMDEVFDRVVHWVGQLFTLHASASAHRESHA